MPRIVLIEVFDKLDEVAPSVSLGYLASYLLKYYGKIDILVERSTGEIPVKLLPDDLVGISVFTQNYNFAITLARNIKEKYKKIPVVIGGPHISPLPESMSGDMDVAVLYEGEETFLDLVKVFMEHGLDKDRLRSVGGLAFMQDGGLIRTPGREYENNLDLFPPPARHLTIKNKPVKTLELITSRGCPYKCVYCGSSAFWTKIRYHSYEYVIEEIDHVMTEYQPSRLSFVDDLFMADRNRFYKIITHIKNKGYHKKTDLFFTGHVNIINEEICEMIKDIKCAIAFGFESGSNRILKSIKTGNVTVEKNQKAVDLLAKYTNITLGGAFMCGLPGETVEDMEMTYKFITSNKRIDHIAISPVTPFPGTQLWKYAFDRGLVDIHMDWSRMRFNSKESLSGKVLIDDAVTRQQLEKMLHKINNYAYKLIARTYSFRDMFRLFRIDPLYIIKNIFGNPGKVFNILFEIITTKISLLFKKKSRNS